ncbi:MAG: sodium:proton antiporter [Propionibacteriaceae bacterium]|jgi:Na+/H+ antiporter NhaD/arsenite permease-like protein|nr:sodium:proton antiporter [Propionibacteriaceae bacterium]
MVTWWMAIPFGVMLIAIAVIPLIGWLAHWWERPLHQLGAALVLGLGVTAVMLTQGHGEDVLHALIEYGQFVILLFGLFTVAGGIALTGDLAGRPKINTIFLAVGTVLASFIGTTGAAMLLIRPLLLANSYRRHRAHLVVFGIFTMANCGGLLTPLGDPPLFLGFLRGVPFTWTLQLWPHWLVTNALLLITFFCLDAALMSGEDRSRDVVQPLGLVGKTQILWFLAIVAAVAFVPSTNVEAFSAGQVGWVSLVPWREVVIMVAAGLSWITSRPQARFEINRFTFAPIQEVAALFIGIFLTMVPVLLLLDEYAAQLPLSALILYFMTGGLSAVLDNAPTYASFFEAARASASGMTGVELVAGVPVSYLVAVSTAAVFWGAMTYIGNGPNFMLRSIALRQGVTMPSFVGYIVWSVRWLLPVLLATMLLFIADPWWAKATGALVAVSILIRAVLIWRRWQGIPLPRINDR